MKWIKAYGKINLWLKVRGKRPDGFHQLETLFHQIDLHDTLRWEPGTGPFELVTPGVDLGDPVDNLVSKAARRFSAASGHAVGGRLVLEKAIPAGGGLGGGSSDAAAALTLFNNACPNPLDQDRLAALALDLGSDVPFFLQGGCRLGEGRGEVLSPAKTPPGPRSGVLILPGIHLGTPDVFRAYAGGARPETAQEPPSVGDNDLLPAALRVSDGFARFWEQARTHFGEGLHMTGSGSTLFVLGDHVPSGEGYHLVPFTLIS